MTTPTAADMQSAIGKPVLFEAGSLTFVCLVKDVKVSYGQPRFLIVPLGGTGERWVEFSSIAPCRIKQTAIDGAQRLLRG